MIIWQKCFAVKVGHANYTRLLDSDLVTCVSIIANLLLAMADRLVQSGVDGLLDVGKAGVHNGRKGGLRR